MSCEISNVRFPPKTPQQLHSEIYRKEKQVRKEFDHESILHLEEKIKKLRVELEKLKPGDTLKYSTEEFPKVLNIGLFGKMGVGKSSLLNSLKYALNGELTELTREQTAPKNFHGGHTKRLFAAHLTPYIRIIDNRGLDKMDDMESAKKEIFSHLEGRSSFGREVRWDRSKNRNRHVTEANRMYCTILVFDASSQQTDHKGLTRLVESIYEWQGRYPVSVLTKVDLASEILLDNIRECLRIAGIENIYEVANINEERKDLELHHQEGLLRMLKVCINHGDRIFELRECIEREEREECERGYERVHMESVESKKYEMKPDTKITQITQMTQRWRIEPGRKNWKNLGNTREEKSNGAESKMKYHEEENSQNVLEGLRRKKKVGAIIKQFEET